MPRSILASIFTLIALSQTATAQQVENFDYFATNRQMIRNGGPGGIDVQWPIYVKPHA